MPRNKLSTTRARSRVRGHTIDLPEARFWIACEQPTIHSVSTRSSRHGECDHFLQLQGAPPFCLPKVSRSGMLLVGHSPEMSESVQSTSGRGWRTWLVDHVAELRQREGQVFLALALVIGALTGFAVVA